MLTPDQQEKDLGTLKFGKPHNFTYTLTNVSDKTAIIINITLGCSSCTTASANKTNVLPNQSTIINAVFTPGSTGINIKNISVGYTIDNQRFDLLLKFKANVIA